MSLDQSAPPTARIQPLRRRASQTSFTWEQSRRQNELLRIAWQSLADREAVIAFLNTHNEQLDGQPLQLALGSDEGLARVESLLHGAIPLDSRRTL